MADTQKNAPAGPGTGPTREQAEASQTPARLSQDDLANPPSAARPPGDSDETVVVGCRMPNGLTLRIYREFEDTEPTQSGQNRTIRRFEPVGEPVQIRGNALDIARLQNQELPDYQIMNGYALTTGVSKAFWDIWVKQHHDFPPLRAGLLFAHATENRARDDAKGRGNTRSGLEPIDPEHPEKTVPTAIARQIQRGDRTATPA